MRSNRLKTRVFSLGIGALALTAAAGFTNAQNVNREYRQWQQAQAQAQRECNYARYRGDMHRCQEAQARAQREYNDYVNSTRGYNNNGYYGNNGYYNNGRTVYNPSTGQAYRVYRNGQYYNTDYRGYELLRQAVNSGYSQGYNQGAMDRRYGRGYNYYGNRMYSEGLFGYQSYVARDQYQYYFQQGFQRGYEDGYNNTFRYGTRMGNGYNILGNVLGTILNLASNPY